MCTSGGSYEDQGDNGCVLRAKIASKLVTHRKVTQGGNTLIPYSKEGAFIYLRTEEFLRILWRASSISTENDRSHLREKLKGRTTLLESPLFPCHCHEGKRNTVRETMNHKCNFHCLKWQPHERLPDGVTQRKLCAHPCPQDRRVQSHFPLK